MNAQSRLTSSSSGHLAKTAPLNGYKGGFFCLIIYLDFLLDLIDHQLRFPVTITSFKLIP